MCKIYWVLIWGALGKGLCMFYSLLILVQPCHPYSTSKGTD